MTDNLKSIELRYQELEARLAANETYADPELVSRLNREQKELEPLVTAYRALRKAQSDLADAEELLSDPEMRELAQQELAQARSDIERLEREIKVLLLPKDPNDGKNVIMEIRAGVGGEESALFAHSLTRMYT
ncbi:MAG: PCRF domain-containing protein, partial [Oscillospiraceae bacterium]|nr:PCRF domain-containing protein [Oscillospiraceae bacterium]